MKTATTVYQPMSPKLEEIMQWAKRDPNARFLSLARLIDRDALARAFARLREDAAVGVDGVTKAQYGLALADNLGRLHERMKAGRYRHQPVRRVHIPKPPDKTRPIGISATEDKVVQTAIKEVLEAIYEPLFYEGSYGFRPGRSAHDALRVLNDAWHRGEISYILEADIQSFFDNVCRKALMEMVRTRVADESFMRLIGKCLHVGILDGEEFSTPSEGTVQGSTLSPMLGNIYLHHVLDEWFERDVRPRLQGKATLVRYADDFVIGFERQADAEQVMAELGERMARYNLTLHPDKTRLLPFTRPPKGQSGGKGPATFDFLGFTLFWRQSRSGRWVPGMKTRTARLRRAIQSVVDFCRGQRHKPIKEQHARLASRLNGHYNYFGVNGNIRSLQRLGKLAAHAWKKWLGRRSQRAKLTWEKFGQILKKFPLPEPTIRVQIWAKATA